MCTSPIFGLADEEIGFYDVSSRYYDPEIGRLISPKPNVDYGEFDGVAGLLGYIAYAYCANNPVMFKDETCESITLEAMAGITGNMLLVLALLVGLSVRFLVWVPEH